MRVIVPYRCIYLLCPVASEESYTLEVVYKWCGNHCSRLNKISRAIANKYCQGKVKRTLKRRLKESESAKA